ncbi:MAG: STAS domain-containing protein [Bacteroidetes bacterium]|nr:STAS domain-containing protein [Bacteroidota bacterium]
MSEILEISKSFDHQILVLNLRGRIDAYWSSQLGSYLDDSIREGHYDIRLNMKEISYISSAGIRVLLNYFKQLHDINGSLTLNEISDNVRTVLEMVGLRSLLSGEDIEKPAEVKASVKEEILDNVHFTQIPLNESSRLHCRFTGNPDHLNSGSFTGALLDNERFNSGSFGIGLGAFGNNFDDCRERFGEFIGLGDVVCYLPANRTSLPDYLIRSGQLIPEIKSLYSIIFSGSFNHTIRYDMQGVRKSIPCSRLFTNCMKLTNFNSAGIVMLAETTGLVGASLTSSPVRDPSGAALFQFPEVRDHLHITTEPEYDKMLTATVGILHNAPEEAMKSFLRPISSGSELWGHFHTAVFSYHPLRKENIELNSAIVSFFENDKIQHILHLINDERDLVGIGDSGFKSGTVWIGEIEKTEIIQHA